MVSIKSKINRLKELIKRYNDLYYILSSNDNLSDGQRYSLEKSIKFSKNNIDQLISNISDSINQDLLVVTFQDIDGTLIKKVFTGITKEEAIVLFDLIDQYSNTKLIVKDIYTISIKHVLKL